MKRGKFIVIEGVDASGKSTQTDLLWKYLNKYKDIDCIHVYEPGLSFLDVKRHIKSGRYDTITTSFLAAAERNVLVSKTIKPALAIGTYVISDRFVYSTLAYQGAVDRDYKLIKHCFEASPGYLIPDMALLLDIDPAVALKRLGERADGLDGVEKNIVENNKMDALCQRYREIFTNDFVGCPKKIVPADGSPNEVQELIRQEIDKLFQ